MDNMMFG